MISEQYTVMLKHQYSNALLLSTYKITVSKFGDFRYWRFLKTSDTLIGYQPIFQMLPKTSLCIRYD